MTLCALLMLDAAAPDRRRRWFAAAGAHLAIDAPATPEPPELDAVRDALLLGEHDALLCRLERLAGCDFDWRPLEGVPPPAVPDFTLARREAVASDASAEPSAVTAPDAKSRVGIVLPDALRTAVEAAVGTVSFDVEDASEREEHDSIVLIPRVAASRVVMASFGLGGSDADRVRCGSLILLPQSFGPRWSVSLDTAVAGWLPAWLAPEDAAVVPATSSSGRDAGSEQLADVGGSEGALHCTVRLEGELVVPLARWAPGATGSARDGESEARHGLPLVGGLTDGTRAIAELSDGRAYRGELLRVGRGWALRLAPDA